MENISLFYSLTSFFFYEYGEKRSININKYAVASYSKIVTKSNSKQQLLRKYFATTTNSLSECLRLIKTVYLHYIARQNSYVKAAAELCENFGQLFCVY